MVQLYLIGAIRCCHVMYNLLYPSIRVRTAPPVSVRVRVRVSVIAHSLLFCMCPKSHAIFVLPQLSKVLPLRLLYETIRVITNESTYTQALCPAPFIMGEVVTTLYDRRNLPVAWSSYLNVSKHFHGCSVRLQYLVKFH